MIGHHPLGTSYAKFRRTFCLIAEDLVPQIQLVVCTAHFIFQWTKLDPLIICKYMYQNVFDLKEI